MKNQHAIKRSEVILLMSKCYFAIMLAFSFSVSLNSQNSTFEVQKKECVNCFNTEIVSLDVQDDCVKFVLDVSASSQCSFALSHFTVEVPCGEISDVKNSRGWIIENPVTDPTTQLTGFKIDEISDFGEDGKAGDFRVEYTVCSDDELCLKSILSQFKVAYKAGTCVFYEILTPIVEEKLSATITKKDVSCYNGNNGIAIVEAQGGKEPYTYKWSNGSNNYMVSGLLAGEYSVIVTDSMGESIDLNVIIEEPQEQLSIVGVIENAGCSASDGTISTKTTGGTAPYTFIWNNGKTTADLNNLYAGTYSLTVMDSNKCIVRKAFTVAEKSDLQVSLNPNFLECHQEGTGTIQSVVSGGTEPYKYKWSNGDTIANPNNLNSGSYSLTITDSNGCSVSASTYIGIKKLSISTAVVNPTCNGGSDGEVSVIDVKYGTAPYAYSWNTGVESQKLTDISSGRYRVTVVDANGCEASRTVNLADRQALNINYSVSARDCSSNDSVLIAFSGSGGMPDYKYFYNELEISSPLKVNGAGEYEIFMQDALGCEYSELITIANRESEIQVVADVTQPLCGGDDKGSANLTITGGIAPYFYMWSDGSNMQDRSNLVEGYYLVEVKDVNGCSASTDFTINQPNVVEAEILDVNEPILCHSTQNIIQATSFGGNEFVWEIIAQDNSWAVVNAEKDKLTFDAGSGQATIIYFVTEESGCMAMDTLFLSCTDTITNSGGSNDTIIQDIDGCFSSEITKITPINKNNCYRVEMWVNTDGTCEHELSHYNVGIEDGVVNWVRNSENWDVEMNATDPTTGIYGFKIDDINGFGQSGKDKFIVEFEVCFNTNFFPQTIPVAYKAANGYTMQLVDAYKKGDVSNIEVSLFPNPFKNNISIGLKSGINTDVQVAIYDLYGNKIKTLYDGTLSSNLEYTLLYDGQGTSEKVLIYKVFTKDGVVQGKILKL